MGNMQGPFRSRWIASMFISGRQLKQGVIFRLQVKYMFKLSDKVANSLDQVIQEVSDGRTWLVIGCIIGSIRRGSKECTGQWGLLRGSSRHFQRLVVEYFLLFTGIFE